MIFILMVKQVELISLHHSEQSLGMITISGPSPGAVQRAREMVDLVEEKIPLPAGRGELLARDPSSLSESFPI